MIRTFVDAGVLIAALRGIPEVSAQARAVLYDPDREFVSSIFLRLEVLPKAIYNKKTIEVQFYETFFSGVAEWITSFDQVVEDAYNQASSFGLGALDSLHVAAALALGAAEIVTTESVTKPLHRITSIKIVTIHPSADN
jgi:predicted nucleic acid-binding protein